MKCPSCEGEKIKITDSRYLENRYIGSYKRRKRKCECSHTWFTYELGADLDEMEMAFKLINHPKTNSHWTNEEDKALLSLRKNGHKNAFCAMKLGRTVESIRKRVDILSMQY